MILSDNEIRRELIERGHINPASARVDKPAVSYSYGLGPAGYDARLGPQFMTPDGDLVYAPKYGQPDTALEVQYYPLYPGQSVLASTQEWFYIPPTLVGEVWGKSSYARQFILVNATPLEPGWAGQITLEITNLGPRTVRLLVGQGICQVRYQRLTSETSIPYGGRYQDQVGVTPFLDADPEADEYACPCCGPSLEQETVT